MTEQIQALWRGQKGYEGRGKVSPSSGAQIMSTQVNSMVIIYGMLYNLLSLLAPLTTLTVSLNYGKMREMIIWQNKVDKLRSVEYNTCNTLHGSASFNANQTEQQQQYALATVYTVYTHSLHLKIRRKRVLPLTKAKGDHHARCTLSMYML